MMKQHLMCRLLFVIVGLLSGLNDGAITIESNGYRDVVIAISDDVVEDSAILDRITAIFTAASQALFTATR